MLLISKIYPIQLNFFSFILYLDRFHKFVFLEFIKCEWIGRKGTKWHSNWIVSGLCHRLLIILPFLVCSVNILGSIKGYVWPVINDHFIYLHSDNCQIKYLRKILGLFAEKCAGNIWKLFEMVQKWCLIVHFCRNSKMTKTVLIGS